ncbi:MAG: hypothetical protein HY763_03260 [Planctomycetes bacterium]|nr:hypothetical protein [Planctomycetota bacterium]
MTSRMRVIGSACLALVAGGCHDGGFSFDYAEGRKGKVTHVAAHICSDHCAHYYEGSRVVVIRGVHRHGPGCGHFFDGAHWVLVTHAPPPTTVVVHEPAPRPTVVIQEPQPRTTVVVRQPQPRPPVVIAPPPTKRVVVTEHRHGPGCGHAFDRAGNKWVAGGHGHVHRPGCGHVYVGGRWTVAR